MTTDVRLAIPVLGGWAALVALLGPRQQASSAALVVPTWTLFTIAGTIALAAAIGVGVMAVHRPRGTRQQSLSGALFVMAGLSAAMTVAFALAVIVQLPSHIPVKPWGSEPTAHYPWFLDWAQSLRGGLAKASETLPGVGGTLVPGLAIGDTSRVPEGLETAMKAVSLTHITAVSGANCVIVTASIMVLGAKLSFSRTWRVVLALAALALFVVLVTPQSSVVRAAVMSSVVLLTMAVGRPGTGLPLLSFAAATMLLINPWWAIDYGFILSVAATAGLLVLSRPLTVSLSRFLPDLLAAVIAIPLAAQLACQPVIILLQPQIPTYGVVANVIAAPAAPLATVTGLLACLVLPVFPPLGYGLLWLSWLPAQWIGQTALLMAALPSPSIPWLAGPAGVLLAGGTSVTVCLALLSSRRPIRRLASVSLVLGIASYGAVSLIAGLTFTARIPQDWVVAACDVGQGDALLIRDGESVALIDTGRTSAPLTKCLSQLGIDHIDLLVLTHYDLDHAGGVGAVVGTVDEALVGTPQSVGEEQIIADLVEGGASVQRGDKGDNGVLGDIAWKVLWPAPGNEAMQDGNPGSITVRMESSDFTALFLGDLGEDAQKALLRDSDVEPVDLVKVAHHGSGDQSPALYRLLGAQLGIISVGKENGYGHPTAKALAMLAESGTRVSRTDDSGLVLVSARAGMLSVWTER